MLKISAMLKRSSLVQGLKGWDREQKCSFQTLPPVLPPLLKWLTLRDVLKPRSLSLKWCDLGSLSGCFHYNCL